MNQMKQFTGTKTVKACPMTLGEAEKVLNRHIDIPSVENRELTPGYLVEYGADGDNYRSWSPKDVFERAYRPSETFLDRMRIEYDQLRERVLKLSAFIFSHKFRKMSPNRRQKMLDQISFMEKYLSVLGYRIDDAEEEQKLQAVNVVPGVPEPRHSLVGYTIVDNAKCDCCPNEQSDCYKLILADGSHICVKDMSEVPYQGDCKHDQ